MKRKMLIAIVALLTKLYGDEISLAKDAAEYGKQKYKNDPDFMKDCSHCRGLDYCLICPGFKKLYEGKC